MTYLVVSLALLAIGLPVNADAGTARVLTKDIVANHQLRLTAARISQSRGQNLVARFEVVGQPNAEPITISFPSHSYTPLETTLMNVVRASVDWQTPNDPYGWHAATRGAVFSAPRGASGYVTDFEQWWFVSFQTTKNGE